MAIGLILLTTGGFSSVQGILFHSTDDPAHNTTPPTGALEGSGWQWLGTWGAFLGTPVHSKFFLTAAHVGGRIGDPFHFRGETYVTRTSVRVPDSDLRLWGVCGSFPDYAPLHTNRQLAGRDLVWFGRGTERGAEVTFTNQGIAELRGWRWGRDTRVIRWGENRIEGAVESSAAGPLLRATFDPDGGPNECHLSMGDSGGPAFVWEDDRWELAGIHYGADQHYSYIDAGPGFRAALFNHQGFYWPQNSTWVPTSDLDTPDPGGLYTMEVAAHADWILAYLARPMPPDDEPLLQRADTVQGPFRDDPDARVDAVEQRVEVNLPSGPAFFRLRSCQPTRFTGVRREHDLLIFDYD